MFGLRETQRYNSCGRCEEDTEGIDNKMLISIHRTCYIAQTPETKDKVSKVRKEMSITKRQIARFIPLTVQNPNLLSLVSYV